MQDGGSEGSAACGALRGPAAREPAPLRRIAQSFWGASDGDDKNDDADNNEDAGIDSWDF